MSGPGSSKNSPLPKHHIIDISNFSHSLVSQPYPDSFTVAHISEALQAFARLDIGSRLHPYQLDILFEPIPKLKENEPALAQLIYTWYDIFDSAFYGGALRFMRNQWGMIKQPGSKLYGWHNGQRNDKAEIWINIAKGPPPESLQTAEEHFLCTLLHEMLHAFFIHFECWCVF